jgi:hypothetical protein
MKLLFSSVFEEDFAELVSRTARSEPKPLVRRPVGCWRLRATRSRLL